MSIRPSALLRLTATSALAVGLCVASPTEAHAQPLHTVTNFSVELGSDLGIGGYADPTHSGGHQCRGTFYVGHDQLISVTKVTVIGKLSPKPARVVVHRPMASGSPKTPSGTSFEWEMNTNEHNDSYVPTGTWTVILSKPSGQTCADAYDGKVHVKIQGLP